MSYGYQNPLEACGSDYLASLDNAYADAEIRTGGGGLLPEGKYQMFVSNVSLGENSYLGAMQLAIGLEVLEGDLRGFKATKFLPLTVERMEYLKNDLAVLGVDLSDGIVKLGEKEVLESLVDKVVDVTIKHKRKENGKGTFQNIFINRLVGSVENVPISKEETPWGD